MIAGVYAKAITALMAGLIGFFTLVVASPSGPILAEEWIVGGTYLVTVVTVFLVPNAIKSD